MKEKKTLIVTFNSGKSSVGKSTILSLLAQILAEKYSTILIWDNDLYKPVQHILNGVEPNIKLIDVITHNISINKAIVKVSSRIFLVGGVNNFEIDLDLSEVLLDKFEELVKENDFDIILVDNHTGFSKIISSFCKNSTINLLFLTDEPISLLDGYGLTKILYKFFSVENICTVVNNVVEKEDGVHITNIFNQATNNFLGLKFPNWGIIPYEKDLKKYFFNLKEYLEYHRSLEFIESLNELAKQFSKFIDEKILS